jgi:PmbA protein
VGYAYDITRERLIRIDGLGGKAAEKAVSLLGARKLNKTAVLPTIWDPISAASYLYSGLGQSIRGGHVVEGRSPLADKIRKEVASEDLTITDDGQDPSSISTEAVDDEGRPQQTNVIIRNGRLVQFLFDSYYADIYGVESTGNASRGSGPFASALPYEATLQIRPKYLKVEPGRKSLDDIVSAVDGQAVLIVDSPIGIFHSSVSTGEFSSVAQSVFLVENGEKKYPLHPVSVSGNFYTGFKHLREVGSDLEDTPFTVKTPSMVFDGFSVVG